MMAYDSGVGISSYGDLSILYSVYEPNSVNHTHATSAPNVFEMDHQITCTVAEWQQGEDQVELLDPEITKTCTYGSLVSIVSGTADYKGRYSYSYKIVYLNSQDSIPVTISELFSFEQSRLQELIFDQIQERWQSMLQDPEISDCLEEVTINPMNLDALSIEFDPGIVRFYYSLMVGGACMNVSTIAVEFTSESLKSFRNPLYW